MASDPAPAQESRKEVLASLCGQVAHLSSGDRAALRRLFLTRSAEATGVVTGLLVRAGADDRAWRDGRSFGRWRLLAHVAAVLAGTGSRQPHRPGASLGRALHGAGYAELRLMRLTSARGPALEDQIVRVARVLAAAGVAPVDLRTLHDLSFDAGSRAEEARMRIARDYFAANHASLKDAS